MNQLLRYGSDYRANRASWEPRVLMGLVNCARCGLRIAAGERWVLGHDDAHRVRITGGRVGPKPEHMACNARTASHKAEVAAGVPVEDPDPTWERKHGEPPGRRCSVNLNDL